MIQVRRTVPGQDASAQGGQQLRQPLAGRGADPYRGKPQALQDRLGIGCGRGQVGLGHHGQDPVPGQGVEHRLGLGIGLPGNRPVHDIEAEAGGPGQTQAQVLAGLFHGIVRGAQAGRVRDGHGHAVQVDGLLQEIPGRSGPVGDERPVAAEQGS